MGMLMHRHESYRNRHQAEAATPDPEPPPAPAAEKQLADMTIAEMRAFAAAQEIDLGAAKKRQEILDAIEAELVARATAAQAQADADEQARLAAGEEQPPQDPPAGDEKDPAAEE